MEKQPLPRLTYTLREVEAMLGLSRSGVYALYTRGELPTVRIGGRRMVKAEDLRRFVDQGKSDAYANAAG